MAYDRQLADEFDEYIENFVRDISRLGHVRLEGLMTMGSRSGNPEDVRPYFRRTKKDRNRTEIVSKDFRFRLPGRPLYHSGRQSSWK